MTTPPPNVVPFPAPLTTDAIHRAIDGVLEELVGDALLQERGWKLINGKDNLPEVEVKSSNDDGGGGMKRRIGPTPLFFVIRVEDAENPGIVLSEVSFYFAYSTWDGKVLYIDQLKNVPETDISWWYQCLARIAVRLECSRLTWRHTYMPDWYAKSANPPETLHGWLTLSMDEAAMKSFAPLKNASRITVGNGPLKSTSIERVIKNCLESKPPSSSAFRLRLAGKDDISIITRLVQGLADYEKEPDAVNLTEEDFIRDGLAPSNHQNQPPLFYCLLVEDQGCDSPTPYTFGMAFFWIGFQHERGRFLYLEDLFLEESYRKKGAGSLLLKTLAEVGQSLACHRLFWQALDWNTPALNFYNKIGAKVQDGVITSRYAGGALKEFAENGVALTQ